MTSDILITIILILLIAAAFTYLQKCSKHPTAECNLENFDINKIHILQRDPEFNNIIDNLIKQKKYALSDGDIKALKNKFQIYNINGSDIQNITKILTQNCKNNFDNDNDNDNDNVNESKSELTPEELADVKSNLLNDTEYNRILSELDKDIRTPYPPDCENTRMLRCNNQKNYYYDVYGNNIISDTKQYLSNYYSTINDDHETECMPVQTVRKKKPEGYNKAFVPITSKPYFTNPFDIQPIDEDYSDFIIPDQYNNDIIQSNILNIDNSRMINPYTIY
ncbi:MAG: hypothetical protein Gaeavirus21_1 [Gaeavirus sp.]|uniref:Uncharacterized protein n=1 Tax=Gaeavirus sp. TaxID=2487767 RepID=A0A3G4ZZ65_9VIRU|nr:MAG: hypothetical protein Gaeavirus21_1 [Gaeavirus sp.]